MIKKTILWLMLLLAAAAAGETEGKWLGEWTAEHRFNQKGEEHIEREELRFNPGTFQLTLSVTIRKGKLLVKNMKIRTSGLWKAEGKILVVVMQELRLVGVEETRGIGKASFEKLLEDLRGRYLSDPIRIYTVAKQSDSTLVLYSGENGETSYTRK